MKSHRGNTGSEPCWSNGNIFLGIRCTAGSIESMSMCIYFPSQIHAWLVSLCSKSMDKFVNISLIEPHVDDGRVSWFWFLIFSLISMQKLGIRSNGKRMNTVKQSRAFDNMIPMASEVMVYINVADDPIESPYSLPTDQSSGSKKTNQYSVNHWIITLLFRHGVRRWQRSTWLSSGLQTPTLQIVFGWWAPWEILKDSTRRLTVRLEAQWIESTSVIFGNRIIF